MPNVQHAAEIEGISHEKLIIGSLNTNRRTRQGFINKVASNPNHVVQLTCRKFHMGRVKTDAEAVMLMADDSQEVVRLSIKQFYSVIDGKPQTGYNSTERAWTDTLAERWGLSENAVRIMKHFTGEFRPYVRATRDPRRMFLTEFDRDVDMEGFIAEFAALKRRVVEDVIFGTDEEIAPHYLMVSDKATRTCRTKVVDRQNTVDILSAGDVRLSPRGSLAIGNIVMQRKGGDNKGERAKQIQFKFRPNIFFK